MNKIYISLLFVLVSTSLKAAISMRNCTLLPITDSLDGAISFPVYKNIERDLKDSNWCNYKSSSDLINILNKYRYNLESYLKEERVLKLISSKLNAGSLIKIKISPEVSGVTVEMEIFGENGKDIYFSEKSLLDRNDTELISQTIINWLELYQANIPHDGNVIGVLGDQATFDIGRDNKLKVGYEFSIYRPLNKVKHPLLNKVVEWKTKKLAKGEIHSVSEKQALGNIKVYLDGQKLRTGDWVVIERNKLKEATDISYQERKANEFGKLGYATLTIDLAKTKTTASSATSNSFSGLNYGFDLFGELWVTRQYFIGLDFARRTGSLSGSSVESDNNYGKTKVVGGYKYLPMGFFYGPQIDFYFGYGNYGYDIDTNAATSLGATSFTGYIFGVKGDIPFDKNIRVFARVDLLLFADMEDDSGVYGGSDDTSNLEFEVGIKYKYSPLFDIHAGIERISNKASLSGNPTSIRHQITAFKLGLGTSF